MDFVKAQVLSVNALAKATVLTSADADAFLSRFAKTRPDPKLLEELRELIPTLWLGNSDPRINAERRDAILKWCLDIGAAAVTTYPYENRDRFDENEKERFQSILRTLFR